MIFLLKVYTMKEITNMKKVLLPITLFNFFVETYLVIDMSITYFILIITYFKSFYLFYKNKIFK